MKKFTYPIKWIAVFTLSFLLMGNSLFSQTFKAFVEAADEAFERKDYYSAAYYYQAAYEFNEEDINVAYRLAESSRLFDAYAQAARHYENVISRDKNGSYPDALFFLGLMKNFLGDIESSKNFMEAYFTEYGDGGFKTRFAEERLKHYDYILHALQNYDELLNPKALEGGINTGFSEFNPYLYKDDFYYSALRFPNPKDVFFPPRPVTRILKSQGEREGALIEEFNLEGFHTSHISLNDKGTVAYFTKCEYLNGKDIRCDIYSAERIGDSFSDLTKLPSPVNAVNATNTHPSWARVNGKEMLFFVSDREGGKGGLDLYSVEINEGNYSNLQALEGLNTEWNEASPFYGAAKDELYFSSQGHMSLGGYDIFKARRSESGAFERIFPLEAPINSTFNDLYYFLNESGDSAYFASNRNVGSYVDQGMEACCNDIFKVIIPNLSIDLLVTVFDRITTKHLPYTDVVLVDSSGEYETIALNTMDSNQASFSLERRKNYLLIGRKPGYKNDTLKINTYDIKESTSLERSLFLDQDIFTLDLYTFKKESGDPLNSAKITIIEEMDYANPIVLQMEPFTNHLKRLMDKGKEYTVIASKVGYKSDTLRLSPSMISGSVYKANLYLGKGDLLDFIPLAVYFDNDQPSPRSYAKKTPYAYSQTYPNYVQKFDEFVAKYTEPLEGDLKMDVNNEFSFFFQLTLPEGKELLDLFMSTLEEEMRKDKKVTLVIQGFASPLASDAYNLNLSHRRINSMVNDLNRYENGFFRKYIANGSIRIVEKPVGERMAPKNISDVVSDRRNSVYSLPASRERRAEIIDIIVRN
jgi:hypothetical protein